MLCLIGLLGGFCFAYCGVPVAYQTVKTGRSLGTPISIAWMISLGCVFLYSYLTIKNGFDLILTLNYSVEFISWMIIVLYYYKTNYGN